MNPTVADMLKKYEKLTDELVKLEKETFLSWNHVRNILQKKPDDTVKRIKELKQRQRDILGIAHGEELTGRALVNMMLIVMRAVGK